MQEIQGYTKIREQKYPQLVDYKEFKMFSKLRARLGRYTLGTNLFLGYCKCHKKYYIDHSHTNGEIRCPICDEEWLTQYAKII